MNLINFKPLSQQELNNTYGGFALLPLISSILLGIVTWKIFGSEKGSVHVNGIGEAKWDDVSSKGINTNKVIYYPY